MSDHGRLLTDAELLQIEIETLWYRDVRGRLTTAGERNGRPAPHVVIAVTTGGQGVAIGSEVPDAVARELRDAIEASVPGDPASRPLVVDRCIQLLEPVVGTLEVAAGPGYSIPPATTFASDAALVRFGHAHKELLAAPDGANWSEEEWRELTDGTLGPWATAIDDGRVVAICHSARLTDRGAEAGVWTAPDHRGKGLAAAVTAAWSALFDRSERELFYSTSADNFSSQNVAKRLSLRPIGWTWQLSSVRSGSSLNPGNSDARTRAGGARRGS